MLFLGKDTFLSQESELCCIFEQKSFMQKKVGIAAIVLTCLTVGYFSSLILEDGVLWETSIKKPFFVLPHKAYQVIVLLLFVLIGIASGRIWNKIETNQLVVKKSMYFLISTLVLNAVWLYLFFGLHNFFLSLVESILLWLLVYETILQFKKIDLLASRLLLPFLGWISYGTVLTGTFWLMNQ